MSQDPNQDNSKERKENNNTKPTAPDQPQTTTRGSDYNQEENKLPHVDGEDPDHGESPAQTV